MKEEKRDLNWVFHFVKYKGLPIESVIKFNPQYIAWLRRKGQVFELTETAWKAYIKAFKEYRAFSSNQQEAWAWGFGKNAKKFRQDYESKMIGVEHEERRKHNV